MLMFHQEGDPGSSLTDSRANRGFCQPLGEALAGRLVAASGYVHRLPQDLRQLFEREMLPTAQHHDQSIFRRQLIHKTQEQTGALGSLPVNALTERVGHRPDDSV